MYQWNLGASPPTWPLNLTSKTEPHSSHRKMTSPSWEMRGGGVFSLHSWCLRQDMWPRLSGLALCFPFLGSLIPRVATGPWPPVALWVLRLAQSSCGWRDCFSEPRAVERLRCLSVSGKASNRLLQHNPAQHLQWAPAGLGL